VKAKIFLIFLIFYLNSCSFKTDQFLVKESSSIQGTGDDLGGQGNSTTGSSSGSSNGGGNCTGASLTALPSNFLQDVSAASGIRSAFNASPTYPATQNSHHIVQWVDINNDDYDDAVMSAFFSSAPNGQAQHQVLINNKNGTFANFSSQTGIFNNPAQVMAFGDFDNDGDQDLFAAMPRQDKGPHQVWINNGQGVFTLKQTFSNLCPSSGCFASAVSLADFNRDGKLDAYIGSGYSSSAQDDYLLFGNGDGTFEDQSSNLAGHEARQSNATTHCDFDNDGDQDIFVSMYGVSHKQGHNTLWVNNGSGQFNQASSDLGFNFQVTGNYHLSATSFGVATQPSTPYVGNNGFSLQCTDINNDGMLDIIQAAISHPDNEFSRTWSDPSKILVQSKTSAPFQFRNEFLTKGFAFNEGDIDISGVDFDNDGRIDLVIQRDQKYEDNYTNFSQKGWLGIFHQKANQTFLDISQTAGVYKANSSEQIGKGAGTHAWSDYDHDGDLDLLLGHYFFSSTLPFTGRPNYLFNNTHGSKNRWLAIKFEGNGTSINRDAIGARITLRWSDGHVIMREVASHRGMWGSSDTRVIHLGLGDRNCDFTVSVRWPNGELVDLDSSELLVNQYQKLTYPNLLNHL
jgi:hypothetical protein